MVYKHVITGAQARSFGTVRDDEFGLYIYECQPERLPSRLVPYLPKPHSYEGYAQRVLNNATYAGSPPKETFEPRPHQPPVIDAIVHAHQHGIPGFTLAYPTGSGKTFIAIEAMNRIRPGTVLVVTTASHVAGWRAAIDRYADTRPEWLVINPDRMSTLFTRADGSSMTDLDAQTRTRAAAYDGTPLRDWDVVIYDEAHTIVSGTALRSRLWRRLVRWSEDGSPPGAFTLNMSATPWTTPVETSPAAHIIAHARNISVPSAWDIDHAYEDWLRVVGFRMAQDPLTRRWQWENNQQDVADVTRLLFGGGRGATADAEQLGMEGQVRRVHPIVLTPQERRMYEKSWVQFRQARNLDTDSYYDPSESLVTALRDVQKASLVKAPHVAKMVASLVAEGHQVIVPTWYRDTVDDLARQVQDALIAAAGSKAQAQKVFTLTGLDSEEQRDLKRRAFQSGKVKVLVTSTTESISLHAGESRGGLGGEDATMAPRVTVFADVITGGKRAFQAEGRAARDGQQAEAIYTYAQDTTEQRWLYGVFRALANTKALTYAGDRALTQHDIASFTDLATDLDPDKDNA